MTEETAQRILAELSEMKTIIVEIKAKVDFNHHKSWVGDMSNTDVEKVEKQLDSFIKREAQRQADANLARRNKRIAENS